MSFDLAFYKRNDNPVTENDVATYLTNNLPFISKSSVYQWDYENPETGVYFVIEHDELDDKNKDFEEYEGCTFLNYTFSLNFFRPNFFALESFPLIEKFVNDLDLLIFDPQDFGENPAPTKFPENYLKEEWIEHNRQVTLDHFEEYHLNYMPVEKSNYLWHFQLQREELQNSLEDDIFVAGILVLESNEDGRLNTICVWPQHIPVILPKVDFVVIKKVYKTIFGKNVEESGVVSYDTIMKQLGMHFETFEHPINDLKVLRQAEAQKIKKGFNALKIKGSAVEFGKMIAMDKFVNSRP